VKVHFSHCSLRHVYGIYLVFVTNVYRVSAGCIISVSELISYPTVHTSFQFRVLTKRDTAGALHRSLVFNTWMIFVLRQAVINKNVPYTPH
jgi:hypothetical protein